MALTPILPYVIKIIFCSICWADGKRWQAPNNDWCFDRFCYVVTKRCEDPDSPSGSGPLRPDNSCVPSLTVRHDVVVICEIFFLAKSTKSLTIPANGGCEAYEFRSPHRPLSLPGSATSLLHVPEQAPFAVTKRAKMPVATVELPCTRKKRASRNCKKQFTIYFILSSSGKPTTSPWIKSLPICESNRLLCVRSSSFLSFRSWNVVDDCALIILFNCSDSTDEASFLHVLVTAWVQLSNDSFLLRGRIKFLIVCGDCLVLPLLPGSIVSCPVSSSGFCSSLLFSCSIPGSCLCLNRTFKELRDKMPWNIFRLFHGTILRFVSVRSGNVAFLLPMTSMWNNAV